MEEVKARSRLATLLAVVGLAGSLVALARPAFATVGFEYRWKTPRVSVHWTEGNETPDLPALRRQIGHWKRLAQTLWAKTPQAPPLEMTVSLFGPEMGSEGPLIRLKAGGRTEEVRPPIEEETVLQALLKVRGGPTEAPPPDDTEPSISPDGQWVAHISWRKSGPEVWVTKRDASTVVRVPFVGGEDVRGRLILTRPEWSADSHQVAWVQGGRLVLYDTRQAAARYVTPADRRVVQHVWPPRTIGALVVGYDDERFDFLDGVSGSTIPVSDLVKSAVPVGRFFWSPTGQRLLFRTQGRIEVAALTVPGKAASAWDRFLNKALGGPPDPPHAREGEQAERLAVLDLRSRRLDAYPVAGTALESGEIDSVSWSPDEQTALLATRAEGMPSALVRFPLRHEAKPETVMETDERLAALGWRSDRMNTDKLPDPAGARYAVLRGDEVLTSEDGQEFTAPYSPSELLKFTLPPGPHGGYLGVESEVLTEDEPSRTIFVEAMQHAALEVAKRRTPDGFLLTYTLDSVMMPLLKRLMDRGPVDADWIWDKGQSLTIGVISENGGVGELVGVAPHPRDEKQAIEVPLSQQLSTAAVYDANPSDQPYPLTDVSTGSSTLALRYAQFDPRRLLLYSALILAAMLALVYLLRKRLSR